MPYVIEKTGRSQKPMDLPSRLLQDRIVHISGPITPELADIVKMQLVWLNNDDPEKPIQLWINSPGGCVYSGRSIKDVIDYIDAKVDTIGTGMVASMGAYLLASGTGTRKATERCRIMVHSVSSSCGGTYHDQKIDFKETEFLQDEIMQELSHFTNGKTNVEQMKKMCERDNYMSAQDALRHGFIDNVV